MPVQINELVIRANVVASDDKGKEAAAKPAAGSGNVNTDEIVKECVELVMEMLNRKNQR